MKRWCLMRRMNLRRALVLGVIKVIKGIVSRDFMVCFLVSFDGSDISTHQEQVLLLLKVHFHIEFFDFCVRA
jgi:hypothetical protein